VTRSAKVILLASFLGNLTFFTFVAQHRFIDADEGSYALAAKLVLAHKAPYLDFFYNQAPLLPYIYAVWMKFGQVSWACARMLSAILTSVLSALVFTDLWRRTKSSWASLLGSFLFAFGTLVFAWFPIVKTYSLAGLLLFASYFLVDGLPRQPLLWRAATAGLFFGLSVVTRSYLVLLFPVFVCWIFRECRTSTRMRLLLWFGWGFVAGTLPALWLFLSSPNSFVFNNLGYHAIRSSAGLVGWWGQKLVIVLQLFLGTGEGNGLQWSLLVLIVLGVAVASPGRRFFANFATWMWFGLVSISLIPTPAYVQYFSISVPFLIVAAVSGVASLYLDLSSRRERSIVVLSCVVVVVMYMAVAVHDLKRYLISGDAVPGVKAAADRYDWKLARVIEVSQAVDQIVRPGEPVVSFWPGDIFQSTAEPVSGFENPFALPISGKLTTEQRERYHIISLAEIDQLFAAHKPHTVVLRNQVISPFTNQHDTGIWDSGDVFRKSLLEHGYVVVRSIGGISIYSCCKR
jgi:4-amino-4-deoxy-L-arabinose transferase-like glycosyltransferase